MSAYDVVVVGSANQDLVFSVRRIPRPGETVLAGDRATHAGGKGLNQAVAAARAGAQTAFVGAIGDDEPGAQLRSVLDGAGIDISRLQTNAHPTGVAVIAVDERAENLIIVASGANEGLVLGDDDFDTVRAAKVLLMQLETSPATVRVAGEVARAAGVQVILNASPALKQLGDLLDLVDVLVVNVHEARTLAPDAAEVGGPETLEAFVAPLLELVPTVVVTLGRDGVILAGRDRAPTRQLAPLVHAVDTTAAGDTFTGAFAAALAAGGMLEDAVWFGSCAASLAIQVKGAAASIPELAAIQDRMRVASRRDGGKSAQHNRRTR